MTTSNALSADSLSSHIATSLPRNKSPQLQNATDVIAIACHAGMLAVGFRLVGLGEDHSIEAHATQEDARPLPQEWNRSSSQSFRYKHAQSSMEYLLVISRLGAKTVINGIAMGDDKPADFHLTTADYISASALPSTPYRSEDTPLEDAKHAITSLFNRPSRLTDLGNDLKVNIIQRLMPSLQKEGYEETRTNTASSTRQDQRQRDPSPERQPPVYDPLRRDDPPARPHPLADPGIMPRRPPVPVGDFPPPGFEDEYEIQRPQRGGYGPPQSGGNPGYGERDLYPAGMGPNDPLRVGGVGPGLRGGPGGGMHPTFDGPVFGGQGGYEGYDPQAPPGARFDPVGPGGRGPQGSGGRFGGGPRGGSGFGGPPNPFSGFGSGDFI